MQMKEEYKVHLDLFEGPLDLLLYLVHKSEVNITDIKVSLITTQYLEYLDLIRELNIDIAGEYLHMAATLIRLKARELLPQDQRGDEDLQEDGIFNREQLIAQLLDYKKFKEAAGALKLFESEQYGAYLRGRAEEIESAPAEQEVSLGSITIFDLLSAFKNVLERIPEEEYRHVVAVDEVKINDRIEHILSMLCDCEEVKFEDLFKGADMRKLTIVVTFMAILELVKMRQISFRQEENFGTIFVTKADEREREKRDCSNEKECDEGEENN